jgi:hypothetical protein
MKISLISTLILSAMTMSLGAGSVQAQEVVETENSVSYSIPGPAVGKMNFSYGAFKGEKNTLSSSHLSEDGLFMHKQFEDHESGNIFFLTERVDADDSQDTIFSIHIKTDSIEQGMHAGDLLVCTYYKSGENKTRITYKSDGTLRSAEHFPDVVETQ